MNNRIKSLLSKLGLLAILVAIAAIYNYFTDNSSQKVAADTPSPPIDYYATNMHITQFQEDGTLKYKMFAEKADHVKQTDIAYLTKPKAHLYQQAKNPWFIESDKGEVGPKADTVKLINNIQGTQIDNQGKLNTFQIGQTAAQQTSDTTRYGEAMIYPNKKYASSNDYAIVTSDTGQSSGVGLKAFFDTNRIQLLSQVKTEIIRTPHAEK